VTDFEKEKIAVPSKLSFDWSRKIEFSVGPAVSGSTYVGLVATDHKSNTAQIMKAVPAHSEKSTLPAWLATCADESKKARITGSLNFDASGLDTTEVETATKTALAFAFDVNPSLIFVTATQARRLESDRRRLAANSWTVKYVVQVAKSKSAVVETAIANIKKNPTEFTGKLEAAVNDLPSTSGARKTISKFTIAVPVAGAPVAWQGWTTTLTTTGTPHPTTTVTTMKSNKTASPTGDKDERVVGGCKTSQWLSSVVAVLVALVGSM